MKTYIRPWSGQNSTRSDTVISRTWTWWLRSHRHCMALSARVTSPSAWTLSSSSSRRDLVEQTSLVRTSLKNFNMKKLYFQDNTEIQLHTEAVYLEKKKTNKDVLMSFNSFFMTRFRIIISTLQVKVSYMLVILCTIMYSVINKCFDCWDLVGFWPMAGWHFEACS